jgi:hypothetical protein
MRITRGNDFVAAAALVAGSYPGRRITLLAPEHRRLAEDFD